MRYLWDSVEIRMEQDMKKFLFMTLMAMAMSTSAVFAQDALAIAQSQEACGEGLNDAITSAEFLEDGAVVVRCSRTAGTDGTDGAFSTTAAAGGGLALIVLAAIAAGGSSSTSDTQ